MGELGENIIKIIKEYWDKLKNEYESKYKETFLKDYEKSKIYFEKMKNYLLERQKEFPKDVDIICTLASIMLELRNGELICIELLENFVKENEDFLDNKQKARIYTNIAFYYEYANLGLKYLIKAYKLNSPFVETYKGLGLFYFSEYQFYKEEKYVRKSLEYFEKGLKITNHYEILLGYAVSLFEVKEYEKAKYVFENLLLEYPNRMRLLLGLAYCETYLGNKEKALNYFEKIIIGRDENYNLNTDDIADYEVNDAYYVLGEYNKFLNECEKTICEYYSADWEHYFYVLWKQNQYEKFNQHIDKYTNEIKQSIEDTKLDEDFSSKKEKEDYIKSYEEELEKLITMANKIKYENYKPEIKLSLYPEFSCFLIDCVEHKF